MANEPRTVARRTLIVLSLYQLLSNNRSSLFTVYFVLFVVQNNGVSIAQGLTSFSIAFVSASLVSPFAGRLSDRLGRRRLFLLLAEVTSLPMFVLIPIAKNFILVSVLFVAGETLLSFGSTALQAFVADITSVEERAGGYGFLSAMGAAGSIVGMIAAGLVGQAFGLGAIFYMVGFLMAGTITIVLFAIPERNSLVTSGRKPMREMKGLAVFSFTTSVRTLGTGAVTAFFGTYAYVLGANPIEVSLVAVAGLGATAILGSPLGRKVDRLGEIPSYIYGTIIVVLSLMVYAVASTWFELLPARIIYAAGFSLLSPAMLSWVTKIAPENRKAEYLGFFSMINSTLWSLGPIPGGIVEGTYGALGLFVFATGATIVSLGSVYVIYSRNPNRIV
ncbi:MAG: MFS transporter [Nitrososphaerota archaeon]|nr:MFS transporter [Nitrososphaerota archaeon]